MNNDIRDKSELLQIKMQMEKVLPKFDSFECLKKLVKTCSANSFQYSFEREYYDFEQLYLKKSEFEINKTLLGKNNYSEIMQGIEYELSVKREMNNNIMQTQAWGKIIELLGQRDELNRKIAGVEVRERPKGTMLGGDEPKIAILIAAGVAIVSLGFAGCMFSMEGTEILDAVLCYGSPGVIAVVYLIILTSKLTKIKSEETARDKANAKISEYEKEKRNINSKIADYIWEIERQLL